MPETAPAVKVAGVKRWGGEVVLAGRTSEDRQRAAEQIAARERLAVVPPFDHPDIVAGQATVGLEIAEALPDARTVVVPVGGGGGGGGRGAGLAPGGGGATGGGRPGPPAGAVRGGGERRPPRAGAGRGLGRGAGGGGGGGGGRGGPGRVRSLGEARFWSPTTTSPWSAPSRGS